MGWDSHFPEIGNEVQVTVGVSENSSEYAAVLCRDMSSTSRETQHSSDEAIENEALSYSLVNSLGNEYVMDGGIQIDGVESLSNQTSPSFENSFSS